MTIDDLATRRDYDGVRDRSWPFGIERLNEPVGVRLIEDIGIAFAALGFKRWLARRRCIFPRKLSRQASSSGRPG